MQPPAVWFEVVRHAPLVSIDLILEDPQQRILLGWRNNRPARNCWFVPGGAIQKGERLDEAFGRVARRELGLELNRAKAEFLGVYQHFYDENFAGEEGVGTHYVVLAYHCKISQQRLRGDAQHGELRWFGLAELRADPAVHVNTKAYFPAS